MFRITARRLAQRVASSASENPYLANNPHRARKVWPPDFSQLTPQQQLRLEKKHKRRVALAHHNPRWDRGVRLVRFLSIVACFIVLTFGAEYRFWGSDYVYKPTEEVSCTRMQCCSPLTSAALAQNRPSLWPHGSGQEVQQAPGSTARSEEAGHKARAREEGIDCVQNCMTPGVQGVIIHAGASVGIYIFASMTTRLCLTAPSTRSWCPFLALHRALCSSPR